MQEQILKVHDAKGQKTHYIFYPERILDLTDTIKGCLLRYAHVNRNIIIADITARQMKRTIQEQLEGHHIMGFLKLESNYNNHKGKKYINALHIAGIHEIDKDTCDLQYDTHPDGATIEEPAFNVAYQVRRIIKRLDQDQELCCQAETETEEEAE